MEANYQSTHASERDYLSLRSHFFILERTLVGIKFTRLAVANGRVD
jgi:hypothetical protein